MVRQIWKPFLRPVSLVRQVNSGCSHAASLDIAWSEENENILASCSGDGTIKIWDLVAPQNPIRSIQAHGKEISSLDWNSNNTSVFLSSSWDDTVKLWNFSNCICVRSFDRHTYCVYSAKWCGHQPPATCCCEIVIIAYVINQQISLAFEQEPSARRSLLVCIWGQLGNDMGCAKRCSSIDPKGTCKGGPVG